MDKKLIHKLAGLIIAASLISFFILFMIGLFLSGQYFLLGMMIFTLILGALMFIFILTDGY